MLLKFMTATIIATCITISGAHADWIQTLTRSANKKATEQVIEKTLGEKQNNQADKNVRKFGSFKCMDDCSGHIAGYRWAQKNNVKHVNECKSNSRSFSEGCAFFIDQN